MNKKYLLLDNQTQRKLWTKQEICNVQGNFCNLFDSDGFPIFEIFIATLIIENNFVKADEWISILKKAGSTHINLSISYSYPENLGWAPGYPINGHDFTSDLAGYQRVIDYCADRDLIPILKMSSDGQGFDSFGLSYGWQWGMDNVPSIVNYLSKYKTQALWSSGFDGCFPNWSRDQTIQYIQMMRRAVGVDGCIDTEFGNEYIHMGFGSDDWADDKLGMLDHFSIELVPAVAAVSDLDTNGIQQIAARLLGPKSKNIEPQNQGPYYLANTTNKDIVIDMYEMGAYPISRKQSTSQDQIDIARKIATYGFVNFGNGLP